jgi:hypothetical protein
MQGAMHQLMLEKTLTAHSLSYESHLSHDNLPGDTQSAILSKIQLDEEMNRKDLLRAIVELLQVNTSNSNAPFFSRTNRTFCPILSPVWFVENLPIVRGPFSRSMSATTYGLSFSKPLGGYRMIVYVAIFPFLEKCVSSNLPWHRGQLVAENISDQPHFGHW